MITTYKDRRSAPLGAPSKKKPAITAGFFIGMIFVSVFFMHYLYLIESEKYDRYYIGQTSNLKDRVQRHNENRCKYTCGKGPWELVGFKTFLTRSEAVKEENRLKKTKNKEYLYYYFKYAAFVILFMYYHNSR